MADSQTSLHYTIGEAVSVLQRMYPDVTHSSLRFLERDGLLHPSRTSGGHRVYRTQDLDRVRLIKSWQAERLSLEDIRQRIARLEAISNQDELWPRFLNLALEGRFQEAAAVVLTADEVGMPMVEIFQDILIPALVEVGHRWASKVLKVGEEHEITELCRDLISELTMRHMGRGAAGPTVVAAAIQHEMHDLGLRMICGLLRQRGAHVHFLGSNVSTSILMESVTLRQPDVVLLSATLEEHRPLLEEAMSAIQRTCAGDVSPVVIIGGQGGIQAREVPKAPGVGVPGASTMLTLVDEIMRLRGA